MPELPEVETALRGVSPYLKGFTIEKIVVRQPQLRWVVSPELNNAQKTSKFLDTSRRAKYLIIHTEKVVYHWPFRHVWLCSNCAAR